VSPCSDLAGIDLRIVAAYRQLTEARANFRRSPCGELVTACEQAEAEMNDLLDLRYALVPGAVTPSLQTA
jgi:hypothetical protein